MGKLYFDGRYPPSIMEHIRHDNGYIHNSGSEGVNFERGDRGASEQRLAETAHLRPVSDDDLEAWVRRFNAGAFPDPWGKR